MSGDIRHCITELARLRRIELSPDWDAGAEDFADASAEGLAEFVARVGWRTPVTEIARPRANEFPFPVFHPDRGWGVAEKFEGHGRLSVLQQGQRDVWLVDDEMRMFHLAIPEHPGETYYERAIDVFLDAIRRRKRSLVLAAIATAVVNFIALGTSLYSMQVYDRVIPRGSFSTLWVLTFALGVAVCFDFALRVIRSRLLDREAVAIDTEVSEYFFARANEVRLDARPPSVGTMAAQLKGLEQIRSTMSSAAVFAAADFPFAILFILMVAALGGPVALVTVVSFPVAVAMALFLGRMIRANTQKSQVSSNRKNGLLVEAIDAAEVIKSNRGQWYFLRKWNQLAHEVHEADLPVKNTQSIAGAIFGAIQQFAYVAIIAWGAFQVYEGKMTQGALIACSILAGRINGPLIGQLPGMIVGWTYTRISLGMLDSILSLPTGRGNGVELLRPSALKGEIRCKDVSFTHRGGKMPIVIPALHIRSGDRIGMIGPIGSGKSTMLKMLAGLYAPAEGQILIDGLDVTVVSDEVLRRHIGYLPQDFRLVNGTLRDNLVLGLADPGDDALMAAANSTGLAALINSHPNGIELPIAEGGRGLSGGQRVLVGLTRLLLARADLLLLDEPTSNLDVDTENQVIQSLETYMDPDSTLIMVTHKPQLLRFTNRVIVVANGQIVMDGPTADVMARLTKRPPENNGASAQVRQSDGV